MESNWRLMERRMEGLLLPYSGILFSTTSWRIRGYLSLQGGPKDFRKKWKKKGPLKSKKVQLEKEKKKSAKGSKLKSQGGCHVIMSRDGVAEWGVNQEGAVRSPEAFFVLFFIIIIASLSSLSCFFRGVRSRTRSSERTLGLPSVIEKAGVGCGKEQWGAREMKGQI